MNERGSVKISGDVTIIASLGKRSVEVWAINDGVISEDDINDGVCRAFEIPECFSVTWNRPYFTDEEIRINNMIWEGGPVSAEA